MNTIKPEYYSRKVSLSRLIATKVALISLMTSGKNSLAKTHYFLVPTIDQAYFYWVKAIIQRDETKSHNYMACFLLLLRDNFLP